MAVQEPLRFPSRLNAARVRSHLSEARSHYQALEDSWDELLAEHEGEWVASYKGEHRFGKTLREALDAAKESGWPLDVIAIDHLTSRRPAVLL